MYSVEWQKHGSPHAHSLIWLIDRITPDLIDNIICAEIPDPNIDLKLHDVIQKNLFHGPCGNLNPNSPCMKVNAQKDIHANYCKIQSQALIDTHFIVVD